jgi:SAM-dependent methyltransferase
MIYDLLAPFYDEVNKDIDYSLWADFIEKIIEREYRLGKPELILDLACGTGRMTRELARRGYDMTGVDNSVEMLDIARNSSAEYDILWLCQDMSEFELYGTVDVTVSCLDSINHITDTKKLKKCFELVHNYLIPDGLFIFDLNTRYKFENVYSDNTFVMETDKNYCVWQNYYSKKGGTCDFYITVFSQDEDGRYERQEAVDRERAYSLKHISRLLSDAGFETVDIYGDYDFNQADGNDERVYVVARCIKDGGKENGN